MTQQGATLLNYNSELVKCIEDLREKREEVNKSINEDSEEKAKIQNDLRILTERLSRINESLARKVRGAPHAARLVGRVPCACASECAHRRGCGVASDCLTE